MKRTAFTSRGEGALRFTVFLALLTAIPAVTASLAFGDHRKGRGSVRQSDRFDTRRYEFDIEYRDRDAIRLQRESISADEEARRETGRSARRSEIEAEIDAREKAYLESRESTRDAAWAARRAPRGYYYRTPGTLSPSLPAGRRAVDVDGKEYVYFQGIFHREGPSGYTVVHAPVGARIPELPAGHSKLYNGESEYYYYFGTYFADADGAVTIVQPQPGVIVPYLPYGYSIEHRDGVQNYLFGGVRYRPFYDEGILVFAVLNP